MAKSNGANNYDASSITVLEGLEAVRVRPGMYIGSVSTKGLNHLIYEIMDNAVDEHLAGYCSTIRVTLEADGSATVSDNGRGIPVGMHEKGMSAERLVFTTLHAGGKFDNEAYKTSGGLHGVGSSVVNALSAYMHVTVKTGGFIYEDHYERGIPTMELEKGLLPVVGKTKESGTTINFLPDDTIFDRTRFKEDEVKSRLHETAYLNPELTIIYEDKRGEEVEHIEYHEPEGIVGFIKDMNKSKEAIHDVIYYKGESEGITVEVAFQYVNEFHENVLGFCNNIYNAEGGTHLTGFKTMFTNVINTYARGLNILKEKDVNFTGADRAKIYIRSGKGGDGHVSFRREKYVPNGGPDGGDGGNGGSVIFEVDEGLNTLTDFRHIRKYCAQDGESGGKRNCRGKNGEDIIVKVPEGTVIRELESGKIIADMSGDNRRQVIISGGKGGNGNQHYATATMQAPKYAQPGQPAKELNLFLELKVIADVGLVGFPNVGKSTLLSRVTNARPKIANYHFTTLNPNLGVVDLDGGKGFVIADIPGLIEGASEGVGLGHEFLRHIERTKVLIHLVDAASTEGRNPIDDIYAINKELEAYNADISHKPQVIAANKIDAIYAEDHENPIQKIRDEFEPKGIKIFPISAVSGQGLNELLYYVRELLTQINEPPTIFESEFNPDTDIVVGNEPYTVEYDEKKNEYVVEGPRIEKMLGYTNLESERGFKFFQKFLKDNEILDELEKLGIQEGDTVRMYGLAFSYYKE